MVTIESPIIELLNKVPDPEIPVVSVVDLGIVREVKENSDSVEVVITPTYSGCPAMLEIEKDIHNTLKNAGYSQVKVTTVLSPAWTTDWMTETGRAKLKEYGIAPPSKTAPNDIECPQCQSKNTSVISEFGSTACKSMYKCNDCLEPFDYFKCH